MHFHLYSDQGNLSRGIDNCLGARVGLLGPKKDKYKVFSLLDKAHTKFWVQAAEDSQFCQALRWISKRKQGLSVALY